MKKTMIKRYMPVTILAALLVTILDEIGYSLHWFEITVSIIPWGYITNISFVYGIFAVGTMWIFRFTFGKFWFYFLTNLLIDAILIFPLGRWFERINFYKPVYLEKWQLLLITTAMALILYVYQLWQESIFKTSREENRYAFNKDIEFTAFTKKKSKT
ncbi:hypothetical protein GK047_13395 [Paenibacillus sp. SYP-B3998]|uniref:Uncharacterized protein n=1 Tax=Paenibacillus sp. SYP-B3998 TaxID=2678564 RepID=A0A6G3ZY32_9BACL|nr:hypothetical protein [Paenibacillus sp. SYP-B3998]NEW07000.1 hypothetical protein [Paenibacillus sp. SYP-B3998]